MQGLLKLGRPRAVKSTERRFPSLEGWAGGSMPCRKNYIAEAQWGVDISCLRMVRSKIWLKRGAEEGETFQATP